MTEAAWPRVSARVAAIALLAALAAACGPQNNRNEKLAHEGRHGHGLRVACADDIEKYCANADRRRRCLKQNIDKVSDACKTALAQRRNKGGNDEGANDKTNNNKTNNTNNNSDDDDNN
ncbi:MAG TPA: hypothetical protein VG274_04485 [Rhizomicrobium sp.]|nr:hypothetical protein [Rhizomicrobium sp.]